MGFLILPHPLANFEIEKYYQKEPRFNEVFSRDNLPNKMVGAYVIKLDEYADFSLFCKKKILFVSIVLVLNMFLKKFKNLSKVKTPKLKFFENKQTIQ